MSSAKALPGSWQVLCVSMRWIISGRLGLTQLPAICEAGGDGEEVAFLWHVSFGAEGSGSGPGSRGRCLRTAGLGGRRDWVHFWLGQSLQGRAGGPGRAALGSSGGESGALGGRAGWQLERRGRAAALAFCLALHEGPILVGTTLVISHTKIMEVVALTCFNT